jgi:methionyl-tRNA formyltransferase
MAIGTQINLTSQLTTGVIYAEKIKKEDAKIQWNAEALFIDRQIRALNPSPGASTTLHQDIIKIWLSENISSSWTASTVSQAGTIIDINDLGICVSGKSGVVRLLEVQKAGSKRMSASMFAKSVQLKVGDVFL